MGSQSQTKPPEKGGQEKSPCVCVCVCVCVSREGGTGEVVSPVFLYGDISLGAGRKEVCSPRAAEAAAWAQARAVSDT